MRILKIKETCIYVDNLDDIKNFYETTLGLPVISYLKDKHIFFRAGSSVLLFFNPADSRSKASPPAHYGGGKQHFAFEVKQEDYEPTKKQLLAKGIAIIDTVIWKSGTESFYFEDPAGNVLEIVPEQGIWD